MKELNHKKGKINWEISAFEIMENENQFLHKQLDLLSIDFHNDTLSRSAEMESSKQRAFDARMTMELVLRKELQALDLNFKERAVSPFPPPLELLIVLLDHKY
jgi:predicted metalloendopeptidase